MARRGLVQDALGHACVMRSNPARKRPISFQVVQDRTQRSNRDMFKCSSRNFPQKVELVASQTQGRSFHGSSRVWVERANEAFIDNGSLKPADQSENWKKDFGAAAFEESTARRTRPEQLRNTVQKLMRRVPQPVAIVTSVDTDTASGPAANREAWRGVTISSFNTVALHPEPIVSFNIKRLSATFKAIETSNRFWVHFLSPNSLAAKLADRFTQGNSNALFKDIHLRHQGQAEGDAEGTEIPLIKSLGGSFKEGRGQQVAFILESAYLKDKTVSIGDHVVLFGTVTDIHSTATNSPCLLYVDRAYHEVRPMKNRIEEHTMHSTSAAED